MCYESDLSPRSPRFVQVQVAKAADPREELARGLAGRPARVPEKYLYDRLGSALFAAITELEEYYPTRTEAQILAAAAGADLAQTLVAGRTLIDLGAGNCEKASRLFATLRPDLYVAVDMSVDYLRVALEDLQRHHPQLDMLGVGLDLSQSLALPPEVGDGPRTLFYPGSSIGNFTPPDALAFLRRVHGAAAGGHLLIGVDLVKARAVLEAAYDDALGVTAAFNRNVLLHVNRLLGSDFALDDWGHVAVFNAEASRVEMHLEAKRPVTVRWADGERRFAEGERIHTENSYKYSIEGFDALLHEAGFATTKRWIDDRSWFAVFVAAAS